MRVAGQREITGSVQDGIAVAPPGAAPIRLPVAAGLAKFTLAASVIAIDFWNREDEQRAGAINGLLANVGVAGGLLALAARATV